MQATLRSPVDFKGTGLHSGRPARMTLVPASAGTGIWFRRTDMSDRGNLVRAHWDAVRQGELCTRIVNGAGVGVSTIEHLMAAIAGCGVHNLLVEIDGPEVPILDGSSAIFVNGMRRAGLKYQDARLSCIEIVEPVEVQNGDAFARLEPNPVFEVAFHVDFPNTAIGKQEKRLLMNGDTFMRELCDSRTFCRQSDVDAMHARGLALGGTLDNAIVFDGEKILNPGGLRHPDEAVRHKMLDALGDMALAGAPILGLYTGHRSGHAMTNALLRELFGRPGVFRYMDAGEDFRERLPGIDLSEEGTDIPRRLVA